MTRQEAADIIAVQNMALELAEEKIMLLEQYIENIREIFLLKLSNPPLN